MKLISVVVAVLFSFFLLVASCQTDEEEEKENTATLYTWCQFYGTSDVVTVEVSWEHSSERSYTATWMAYDELTIYWKGSSPLQVTIKAWRETKSSEGDYFETTLFLEDGETEFLIITIDMWQ
jgi:hypothetical protein